MEKKMEVLRHTRFGLCSTCCSDTTCTYPRREEARVLECLDFDGEVVDTESSRPAPRPSSTRTAPKAREPGLCGWCEMKPTCTFPKPAGGVWFCEEYR
jgi:hypothetical protein